MNENSTAHRRTDYLVTFEVLGADWRGGVTTAQLGPDGTGRPYTDFEDIRKIIALKRGITVESILIRSVELVDPQPTPRNEYNVEAKEGQQ